MFKKMLTALLMGLVLLTSPALAKGGAKLGKGDYFIYKAPRITPDGNVTPQQMTTGEFDLGLKLDNICRVEAKRQNPSAFKTIFLVALRNAPGAFIGGGLGAMAGGFTGHGVSARDYAAYSGAGTVGASIGAGINAYEMGKHNNVAGCVMQLVSAAKRQGYLRDVYVAYNTFPVYGHPIRRADLPAGSIASADDSGDSDADDRTTPPPGN